MLLAISLVLLPFGPAEARDKTQVALQVFLAPEVDQRIVDQDGRHVVPEGLIGDVAAVTFFDTECSILCVNRLLDLVTVVKSLPAVKREHVKILALTTSPTRDTPTVLNDFAKAIKLDVTALTLASGEPAETAKMLSSVGWRSSGRAPDDMPPTIFVFDRQGNFAMRYGGNPVDQRRLAQDLTTLAELERGVGQSVVQRPSLH